MLKRLRMGMGLLLSTVSFAGSGESSSPSPAGAGEKAADPAEIRVAAVFGSNMVLQRDRKVPVWGWAKAGTKIVLSCAGQSKKATADAAGYWKVELDPTAAGGPYELKIENSAVRLANILFGDVWLLSGQSNMDFGVNLLNGVWKQAPEKIAAMSNSQLRLMPLVAKTAGRPQPELEAPLSEKPWMVQWHECNPNTVVKGNWGGFSAVGYFFGNMLQKELNVPIGLVQAASGGTYAETWTSQEGLRSIPGYKPIIPTLQEALARNPDYFTGNPANKNIESSFFNGTIAPLVPLAIKGVLWYQGEHNAGDDDRQYDLKLKALIADWRRLFGQDDLSFYLVQLHNWHSMSPVNNWLLHWEVQREMQARVARDVPHCGLAVTIDLEDPGPQGQSEIHPMNKEDVGRRLALLAEARTYGKKVVYSGPVYARTEQDGGRLRLRFEHIGKGLMAKGDALVGFEIADESRKFLSASALIDGNSVVVSSPAVTAPVAVRYNFKTYNNPLGNLYNQEGLPAVPFRTDDWPLDRASEARWQEFKADSAPQPANNLQFTLVGKPGEKPEGEVQATFTNGGKEPVAGRLIWQMLPGSGWAVTPAEIPVSISGVGAFKSSFKVAFSGEPTTLIPVPVAVVEYVLPDGTKSLHRRPLPAAIIKGFLQQHRPQLVCRQTSTAPACDGKAEESCWKRAPDMPGMVVYDLDRRPEARTEAWFAADAENLYLLVRCQEPQPQKIRTYATDRDDACYMDDSVELLMVGNPGEPVNLVHFAVNAAGMVYDARNGDAAWNADVKVGTQRETDGWTLELAVTWKSMGIPSPRSGDRLGFLLARTRPAAREMCQFPPAPGGHAQPAMFADLIMKDAE